MATNKAVKLDEATYDRLKALGEARQRTPHWLMREAIREYIEKEEAFEARNREADEAWEEYKLTGKGVTHETMSAWFDDLEAGKESECPNPELL
ncbi:MAG: ribbon-helix-helix protein, CopG family [Methylovulum sp.]|nr:ribbon-helix-helix protein, CopG family [Methylovulum sp.]